MARTKWLASLEIGDTVRLVTPCARHIATVERIEPGRIWVVWDHGNGLGHSATWVCPETGTNSSSRIEPAVELRESFND